MDFISQGLMDAAEWALSLLPDSPFVFLTTMATSEFGEWIGYFNWVVPVYTWLGILQIWLTSILIYYVIQIVLRWVKAIE